MKKKNNVLKWALTIFMLIVGVICITPFIFMVSSSFKVSGEVMKFPWHLIPESPTIQNFIGLFTNGIYNFQKWYANTIVMTGLTIIIKVFFVSFTAYGFAKINFKGKDAIFLVLLSAMMIPSDIMILPRYIIFKDLHILDTMWALILPSCVDVYFVFLLRQSFISIPESISEAAKIDGCSYVSIFTKIILPLIKPALVTSSIFSFMWRWDDFLSALLYINKTAMYPVSLALKLFCDPGSSSDYGAMFAMASLSILPSVLIFIFFQKCLIFHTFLMVAPLIRLAQKRKTVIIQRVIFDLILLVAPPAGVYLILGQKFLVFQRIQINKIRISRKCRVGLVRAVPVAGRSHRKHLPVPLLEIDK